MRILAPVRIIERAEVEYKKREVDMPEVVEARYAGTPDPSLGNRYVRTKSQRVERKSIDLKRT